MRGIGGRGATLVLVVAYAGVSALSALFATDPTDLDAFFLPSARLALTGHPLDIYSVRQGIYPDANGPLSLAPLTTVAALASGLGRLDDMQLRRMLVMALFSIFPLLMSREAVAAIDIMRGSRIAGRRRLLLHALLTTPPLLWQSTLMYGHIEQPIALWLLLYGVRALSQGRDARGGAVLGLAVLTRSLTLLLELPVLLLLVTRRHRMAAASAGAAALLTVTAGVVPFLLARPADTLFSLVTFRGALPVGGSILELAAGTPLEWWAQHADGAMVLAAALLSTGIVLWRRRAAAADDADVYGLLALAALCSPLLAKTVWPYYLLEGYVLSTVWVAGTWRRRTARQRRVTGLVPVLVSAAAGAAEVGVTASIPQMWRRADVIATFALLSALVAGITTALLRGYGNGVGRAVAEGVGAAGGEAVARGEPAAGAVTGAAVAGAEPAGGAAAGTEAAGEVGEPPGAETDGVAGTGVEVGPSGGVGQFASAALKGVGEAGVVEEAPAGGLT